MWSINEQSDILNKICLYTVNKNFINISESNINISQSNI